MSDEIKDLSDLVCQDDELELSGGEGGGLRLKRSEMNLLARMSDVYPITREERRLAVDCLVDIIKTSKSRRTKISSVKALTGLDRTNQNQMALYLTAKKMASDSGKSAATGDTNITVNIVEQVVAKSPEGPKPVEQEKPTIIEHVVGKLNGFNGHAK